MPNKFQNKYRISSTRLQNWDYRWAGAYFITICTKNREHYFGEIENGEMILSHIGVIADILWYEIKNHSKSVELDAFVVMPNHIHGILILDGNNVDDENNDNDTMNGGGDTNGGDDTNVETGHALSLQQQPQPQQQSHPQQPYPQQPHSQQPDQQQSDKTIGQQRFQNIGKNSVSSIIGSYKSAVTRHAGRLGFDFAWQERFHDHIIRDEQSFKRIQKYIRENPKNWKDDKFYDK